MILFFGDSFINIFTLLNNKYYKIYKYKGASIKGLTKKDNKNRGNIINIINNYNKINCCIFSFGQVDIHFSYYYKKFVKKEKFTIKNMIIDYVDFISSFDNCENKIVIGIYPSAVNDEDVYGQLLNYGIINNDIEIDKYYFDHKFRHKLFSLFNDFLKNECIKRNIQYIDVGEIVLDKNNKVKEIYKDPISKYNIHLLWEPLIFKLLEKIKGCNIDTKNINKLEESLHKYIIDKKIRKNL